MMKSHGIPVSGVNPVLPARAVSARIKPRTMRRDVSSFCVSDSKSERQDTNDPGLTQTGIGLRYGKHQGDRHLFWQLIGSILPVNHKAGQDGAASGHHDRDDGLPETEPRQASSQSQNHSRHQRREWRHQPGPRIRRAGMAKWLPAIASFLITGIVIGAVVGMTIIELAVIFGRPD